ncbi:MAG TPA: BON domain-containing protein [Longimicrobiales bacterium]
MGWYDEAFRESGRGHWRQRPGQGWWTQPRSGQDWSEGQGGGYGGEYRERGYPYATGYRPDNEGGYARRARQGGHFGNSAPRFGYDEEYRGEPGGPYQFEPRGGYRSQRGAYRDEYREQSGGRGGEYAGEQGWGRSRVMHDDDVLESVRENLFQDSYVDPERIHVRVQDGVVTLSGFVDDYLEARYAWDDAWESPGVRGVINQLEVKEE